MSQLTRLKICRSGVLGKDSQETNTTRPSINRKRKKPRNMIRPCDAERETGTFSLR